MQKNPEVFVIVVQIFISYNEISQQEVDFAKTKVVIDEISSEACGMYHLTKRQESILYYILMSRENISTKKLASNYQLSERSIHNDLDYINSWLKERGGELKKNKPNGIFLDGTKECRQKVLGELFQQDVHTKILIKTDRVQYIYNKLLLADRVITSAEFVNDLMISRPTALNGIKSAEQKLAEVNLKLLSKKGAGYWIEGKETVRRIQIGMTIMMVLMKNRIHNYDTFYRQLNKDPEPEMTLSPDFQMIIEYLKEIDIYPIYDMLNIMRKEYGILISDADSFDLFVSIAVMVKRLLGAHSISEEDLLEIEKNEESRRFVLARGICEQLEDDYNVNCSKSEMTYMMLRLISCNVSFVNKEKDSKEAELGATIDLMVQVVKDYEIVQIEDRYMQDLKDDLYEHLSLLLKKKKLHIGTQNPMLVQTKAGYPHIFAEAVRMADIFKMREGVTLTEEDIGTLTIYLAAYSEEQQRNHTKTALIVCNEGKGLSKLLYNRVKNNISVLTLRDVVSVNELSLHEGMLEGVDLIISTTELDYTHIPVFCVNPIISVFDIRYINDYLAGNTTLKVMEAAERQEHYLEDAIMGILSKYLPMGEVKLAKKELEYILAAGMGYVSEENAQIIQEDYAYKAAMVIVKLADMFIRIKKRLNKTVDIDTMMGLAIHIMMSIARWEKKEFFQDKGSFAETAENAALMEIVELFLTETSEIYHYSIGKGEAVAIMRYLI